ncbi:probable 2-oxoglutarate-dependent dioxygenase AOP1 [Actinidia eriantha]|uniref:probable 2-oxoglutarate-dependent dioxygenase AOP1 n=1 Tax=Actinidia eriantha TaxID=165200 RepID=UPI002587642B|nr:probable 2-oxoglutarate-dependent dioxygenase AOP1 [Actinidia eriantha]
MGSLVQHKLPIVDFTKENLKLGTNSWHKASRVVVSALEEYGCFVALYDGVSLGLHDEVFHAMEELFNLPTSTKVQNKSNKPLYGYVGQIPIVPLYESMGIDEANTIEGIQKFEKAMWPNGNDGFSEAILSFSKLIAELEQLAVRMVFESYGLEKYYESHLNSASYLCRVMKYRSPENEESNMGFVAHTDKSFMTVLHQNQVDGLEIKAKDGQWFGVELCPSSFVVMAGDAIMAWSNGRVHSPLHRVTMNGNKARYSLGQFSFMKETVKTPEELINDEHPLQYKPFDHLEFLDFYSQTENRRLENAIRTYCGI